MFPHAQFETTKQGFLSDNRSARESDNHEQMEEAFAKCEWKWEYVWYYTDSIILLTGVLANAAMLWFLLRNKNAFTASQVLGLNLAAMNLIYLSVMPVSLSVLTPSNFSVYFEYSDDIDPLWLARDVSAMINMVGCPLLLTGMCVERYLAVVKPVLYLKSRKLKHRLALSFAVWCITSMSCVSMALHTNTAALMMAICLAQCVLFQVMLACLGGLVWFLLHKSPAHAGDSRQARHKSPQRRRAVVNVLAVVVPSVVCYFPVSLMAPIVLCFYNGVQLQGLEICAVLQLSEIFPSLSVYIGPLFYLSKARQTCCSKKQEKTLTYERR